jgi:hypothetical protein
MHEMPKHTRNNSREVRRNKEPIHGLLKEKQRRGSGLRNRGPPNRGPEDDVGPKQSDVGRSIGVD